MSYLHEDETQPRTAMRTAKRVVRREARVSMAELPVTDNEVPLQIMVPASVRRRVGVLSAERGENLRTTILRGLIAIGVDVPKDELVDRRGRRRQE
jgi:hypothetical protein